MCIYASVVYDCGWHIRIDDEHIKSQGLDPRFRLWDCSLTSCAKPPDYDFDESLLPIRRVFDIVLSGGKGAGPCPHHGSMKCPKENSTFYQLARRGDSKVLRTLPDDPGMTVLAYDFYLNLYKRTNAEDPTAASPLTAYEGEVLVEAQLRVACDGDENEEMVMSGRDGEPKRMHWY